MVQMTLGAKDATLTGRADALVNSARGAMAHAIQESMMATAYTNTQVFCVCYLNPFLINNAASALNVEVPVCLYYRAGWFKYARKLLFYVFCW